jgi:hypothetical protein
LSTPETGKKDPNWLNVERSPQSDIKFFLLSSENYSSGNYFALLLKLWKCQSQPAGHTNLCMNIKWISRNDVPSCPSPRTKMSRIGRDEVFQELWKQPPLETDLIPRNSRES